MKTISHALFAERLAELAAGIEETFPRIRVDRRDPTELWLKTEHCSGLVDLRSTDDPVLKQVRTSIASGRCLTGSCEAVRDGLNDYNAVMDALAIAGVRFNNIFVARD